MDIAVFFIICGGSRLWTEFIPDYHIEILDVENEVVTKYNFACFLAYFVETEVCYSQFEDFFKILFL